MSIGKISKKGGELETETKLLKFIGQDLLGGEGNVTRETLLFSSNLLDSFSLVELITFLDEECGVKVSPEEILVENFDTINRIVVMIAKKINTKGITI